MNTQNELKAYTDGFSSRLDALFDEIGIRPHGRGVLLAEWTGLSKSGARKMYLEDRPPSSDEAFKKLVHGLRKAAEQIGRKGVNEAQIENYLLHDGQNPFNQAKQHSDARKHFSSLGAATQAKIYMLIDEDGKKRGENIFDELSSGQLELLVEKISEIHLTQNLDVNSSQMVEIVGALIKLARQNVLI